MMPIATATLLTMPSSKQKIGFSIDSIVGNKTNEAFNNFLYNNNGSGGDSLDRPISPHSEYSYSSDINIHDTLITTSPKHVNHRPLSKLSNSPNNFLNKISYSENGVINPTVDRQLETNNNINNDNGVSSRLIENNRFSIEKDIKTKSTSSSPILTKTPIIVPGISANIVRPFGIEHEPPDIKHIPSYLNGSQDIVPNIHHGNNQLLAAQFHMAAALAHHGQSGPPVNGYQSHPMHYHNSVIGRESYPLYPWLLSRHGRIFPHRFPGNFLLQPFRKPKRIRTAFSPSQLLKLEHAFEGNHYVVGSERKSLAQNLNLSETQVKVWFQNRRTKHKRMQQEEDIKDGNISKKINSTSDDSHISYDEDELIDMDDYSSDEDNRQ